MANKIIKGLTVEIGGDTKKLGDAIDEADKKSRQLSAELGEITKALKFNDANPELLAQKQTVLNRQIEQTNEKLKMLRELQEQANAAMERGEEVSAEQQRALQREIIATESRLTSYQARAAETADQIGKIGNASETASQPVKSLSETVKEQESTLSNLKKAYIDIAASQGKDSDAAQRLAEQIGTLSAELSDNKAKLDDANKAADAFDNTIEKASVPQRTLKQTIEEQKKALGMLKGEYAEASAAQGKESASAQELARQIEVLSGRLSDNQNQLTQAEEEADKLDKTMDSLGDSTDDTEKDFSKLTDTLGACLQAAVATTAAIGTAAVGMTAKVVNAYGELEQNLGGSVSVFGKYAEQMQQAGENAYKNLGISQSEYLATANKMGALFQGVGFHAEESASITEKVMQRAADMASVMGIDMTSAMESIAGAAKGNFTMMDNLGVSINDTTLKAYAASHGLGELKTTQDKVTAAMQMFLETTEQYDGNFAREATETISGSFGLLRSSFDSLVAGLGNGEADIENMTGNVVDAFLAVTDNVIPVVDAIGSALPNAVSTMVADTKEHIPTLLPVMTDTLSQIFASLAEAVPEIAAELLKMILQLAPTLLSSATSMLTQLIKLLLSMAPDILRAIMQIARDIISELSTILPELLTFAVQIIPELVLVLLDELPTLTECGITLLTALVSALPEIISQICSDLPHIIDGITDTLLALTPEIIQCGITLLVSLVKALPQVITQICAVLPQIITSILSTLISLTPLLIDCGMQLFLALIDALPEVIDQIVDLMPQIIDSIILALLSMLPQLIDCGIQLFLALVQAMPEIIEKIISVVPKIVSSIVDAFRSRFGQIRDVGKQLIEGLWNGIQDMAGWIHSKIVSFGDGILDSLKDFFGIASPSKVMRKQIGHNLGTAIPLGVADGVADEEAVAIDSVQKMADNIADTEFSARRIDFANIGASPDDNPLVFERNLREQWYANQPDSQIVIYDPVMMSKLDKILTAVERGQVLLLDGDTLVGGTADRMNNALGMIEIESQRR